MDSAIRARGGMVESALFPVIGKGLAIGRMDVARLGADGRRTGSAVDVHDEQACGAQRLASVFEIANQGGAIMINQRTEIERDGEIDRRHIELWVEHVGLDEVEVDVAVRCVERL